MSNSIPAQTYNIVSIVSDYNVKIGDNVINVNTSSSAVRIYLPNIKSAQFNLYAPSLSINDIGGSASVNSIFIFGTGGDLIDGELFIEINVDNGSVIPQVCSQNEWLSIQPQQGGGGSGVTSVNGFTGTVNLDTDNIPQGSTNFYITPTQAADITANNAKVGITPTQAADITANNAKVGITPTQAADITANNAKVGITPTQAADITANNAKVGITPTQASDITANNAKVGITPTQAADITANNAKVGITPTQAAEITANTAKVGITPTQAADITANNAKVGITPTQASDITANNAKQTNATHTGDVTGSGALSISPSAISGKSSATLLGTEEILVNDAGTLKKTTVNEVSSFKKNVTIQFSHTSGTALNDSSSYYITDGTSMGSTPNQQPKMPIPAGVLTSYSIISFNAGTFATSESSEVYLDYNDGVASELLSNAVLWDSRNNKVVGSKALTVNENYGWIRLVTPVFATNPTSSKLLVILTFTV